MRSSDVDVRAAECRADMANVHRLAGDLRAQLRAIDAQAGPQTWSGPGGDRWRGEWSVRRRAIENTLAEAEAQAPALIHRASQP